MQRRIAGRRSGTGAAISLGCRAGVQRLILSETLLHVAIHWKNGLSSIMLRGWQWLHSVARRDCMRIAMRYYSAGMSLICSERWKRTASTRTTIGVSGTCMQLSVQRLCRKSNWLVFGREERLSLLVMRDVHMKANSTV